MTVNRQRLSHSRRRTGTSRSWCSFNRVVKRTAICECAIVSEARSAMTNLDTKEPIRDTPRDGRGRSRAAGAGIPLGRWGGVPVSARWSVLVILALFAEVLATSALPAARPGHATGAYWLVGLLTAAVFLVTVVAHEVAHAVTARHYGVQVKGITLWMLGGATELDGESRSPRAEAMVAVAGPATSIGLGAISAALAWSIGGSGLLGAALSWLAGISVFLGVFNLLPGAPLDGGRLLRALLWRRYNDRSRAGYTAARVGRGLGFILIALGFVELVLTGSLAGLWLGFVGCFIVGSATVEARASQAEGLAGLAVSDVMTGAPIVLADWWTVEQVLAGLSPDPGAAGQIYPLVDFGGQATGALTRHDLDRVPVAVRADTRIRDIVRARRIQPLVIQPGTKLSDVALVLRQHAGIAVVVDHDNHPLGIVTTDDLTRAARSAKPVVLGFRHRVDRYHRSLR
jgi:Zn-dependent protease